MVGNLLGEKLWDFQVFKKTFCWPSSEVREHDATDLFFISSFGLQPFVRYVPVIYF